MEKIKPIINKELNLTDYQYKGILLEVTTYLALKRLGIEPYPLHNPFNNDYAKDQHLKVDLIFIHDGKLYGVECKNLSERSHVSMDFIDKEIIKRFSNTGLPFDCQLVIFGLCNYTQVGIPEDFSIIELGYQVNFYNIEQTIDVLTNLLKTYINKPTTLSPNKPKLSCNTPNNHVDSIILLHGYKRKKRRLDRIDKKLKSG